jgi:hypothetical protein
MQVWCDSLRLNSINETKSRIEDISSWGSPGKSTTSLILSANWIKDVVGGGYPGRTRGTKPKHCLAAMYDIMDKCGAENGQRPGNDVPR